MLTYTLDPYRGDTFRKQFRLWADKARTVPVDLTGVTVAAEIRQCAGGTVIATIACVVTLPQLIDISLAPSATAQLPTTASWDLQLTYAVNALDVGAKVGFMHVGRKICRFRRIVAGSDNGAFC